jgi:hypothetical protein
MLRYAPLNRLTREKVVRLERDPARFDSLGVFLREELDGETFTEQNKKQT